MRLTETDSVYHRLVSTSVISILNEKNPKYLQIILLPSGVVQQFSHISPTSSGIAMNSDGCLNFGVVKKGLNFLSSFFFSLHSH